MLSNTHVVSSIRVIKDLIFFSRLAGGGFDKRARISLYRAEDHGLLDPLNDDMH
jgi:hypothetical protein